MYVECHFARGKSYNRVRVRRDVVEELKGLVHRFFMLVWLGPTQSHLVPLTWLSPRLARSIRKFL